MTETSPLGSLSRPAPKHKALSGEEQLSVKLKQGRAPFGVEIKIVDEVGASLPWDGKASGELAVRGPWIAKSYFRREQKALLDQQGYFPTGDISTINHDGWMSIVDRAKDVIKSGGEWISSLDLENVAAGHPAIAEAAVIGISHPKWQERPLLICVAKPDQQIAKEELLGFMAGKVAKWWLPDDVAFVDELPHNATGKIHKMKLREIFRDYRLPGGEQA